MLPTGDVTVEGLYYAKSFKELHESLKTMLGYKVLLIRAGDHTKKKLTRPTAIRPQQVPKAWAT